MYYDEDTTTLTSMSLLVSEVTIAARSLKLWTVDVASISSIISVIIKNEYGKTRNNNDHD